MTNLIIYLLTLVHVKASMYFLRISQRLFGFSNIRVFLEKYATICTFINFFSRHMIAIGSLLISFFSSELMKCFGVNKSKIFYSKQNFGSDFKMLIPSFYCKINKYCIYLSEKNYNSLL